VSSGNYLTTFKKALDGTRAINLASDTFKAVLLDNTYIPNFSTDSVYSDVSAHEVVGSGYSAGGVTLSGLSWSTTGGVNKFTATNPSWSVTSVSAQFLVIYDSSASNALISCLDFGGVKTSEAGTFSAPFSPAGIFTQTPS